MAVFSLTLPQIIENMGGLDWPFSLKGGHVWHDPTTRQTDKVFFMG